MNIKLEDLFKYQFLLKYSKNKISKEECMDYIYEKYHDESYYESKKKYISDFEYIIELLLHGELSGSRYRHMIQFPRAIAIFKYLNIRQREMHNVFDPIDKDCFLYFNITLFSHIRSCKTIDNLMNPEYLKNVLVSNENILYPDKLYNMIKRFSIFIVELDKKIRLIKKEYRVNPPKKEVMLLSTVLYGKKIHNERINIINSLIEDLKIENNDGFMLLPLFTIIVYFLAKKYNICNFKNLGKRNYKIESIDLNNLFRGKSLENIDEYSKDEWVYGKLTGNKHIIPLETDYAVMVDKDTISKFTGKTDINDKKIFDGDIIKTKTNEYVKYGLVEWSNEESKFVTRPHDLGRFIYIESNKWDNPELLSEITANKLIK